MSVVVAQPGGRVLICGPLTFINGTNRYGSARLKADGSWDGTFISGNFNPDLAFVIQTADCRGGPDFECSQSWVASTVLVQADGKVLVGGPKVWFGRRNADGSEDTSFNPDMAGRSWVASIVLQADGRVLIGGGFSTLHGTNVSYGIARLNANGTLDERFNPGTGTFGVSTVAVQADGNILIGGNFITVKVWCVPAWPGFTAMLPRPR